MRFVYTKAGIDYIQLEEPREVNHLHIDELGFFKGYGITDYPEFFKMWLRRFPKPIIIVALKGREVIGFVYIEEWGEGIARDGQSVYTLRSIEVSERKRRRGIGKMLALLAMAIVPGHVIVKPINPNAEKFFRTLRFREYQPHISIVDLTRHMDHLLLTAWDKKKLLQENDVDMMVVTQISSFKLRTGDNGKTDLTDQINRLSEMASSGISSTKDTLKEGREPGTSAGENNGIERKREVEIKGTKKPGELIRARKERDAARKPPEIDAYNRLNRKAREQKKKNQAHRGMHSGMDDTSGKPTVTVVYSRMHFLHFHRDKASIEAPKRIESIYKTLIGRKVCTGDKCLLVEDYQPATDDDIALVHDRDYIRSIKRYCTMGGGLMGTDMFFTKDSYEAAAYAVGGAMLAVDLVYEGKSHYSAALIRPPGHHASRRQYSGFCIFNNSAVAARHLQKKGAERVAIVDWDAHAANGTMDIFYEDPTVLLISIHQDPSTIYPHIGYVTEIGEGPGKGYTLNIPMPVGSSDGDYRTVMEKVVLPALSRFGPDFVIGVNGFDAYWGDPYTKLLLTSDGYYNICRRLAQSYRDRFAIIQEGGYNRHNPQLFLTILDALMGTERSFRDNKSEIIKPSEREQYEIKRKVDDIIREITTKHPLFR